MRVVGAALFGVVVDGASLAEIAFEVNSVSSTWTAQAPSKFVDSDDVKTYLGAYLPGDTKHKKLPRKHVLTSTSLPASFDSRSQWPDCGGISSIRDQSACGSCWAFGSVDSFQDRACIATGKDVRYSPEDTAFCSYAGDGCQGGNTAWEWFEHVGVVTGGKYDDIGKGDTCLPYSLASCAHHVPATASYPTCPDADYSSPQCKQACSESSYGTSYAEDKVKASSSYSVEGVSQIQTELMTHGPLYVAFTVYEDFPTYRSGVYKHTSGSNLGGHAVELIGWGTESGEDYWLIKNSWNEEWGDNGFFKIARGVNECGIEDDANGGIVGSPAPTPAPHSGTCDSDAIASQADCESTLDVNSGDACDWCYLEGLHIGYCTVPSGCNGGVVV